MRISDRILIATAYLFGIPALYIVLTDARKKKYVGGHGAQAFFTWIIFFIIFFGNRYLTELAWRSNFSFDLGKLETALVVVMAAYAVYAAVRSSVTEKFWFVK